LKADLVRQPVLPWGAPLNQAGMKALEDGSVESCDVLVFLPLFSASEHI
jgi:hypothetical protein